MKRRPSSVRHDGHVLVASLIAATALTACGGGGGDSTPEPTAIPSNLGISAPAAADVGGATQFGSSAATLSGLKYSWDFGDGTSSTDATPTHSYAQGGDYTVTLRVTNEVGNTGETRFAITVSNTGLVKGLSCSGAQQSGWCWEQPTPSGNDRYDAFFIDANTGWTVGANGTILKTTDGGASWQRQASGIDVGIRAVRFTDANNGWAQGEYGALLHTTDGGASWSVGKLPGSAMAPSLQVFDAKTLSVKDSSGYVYSSDDAGQTWRTSSFVPSVDSKSRVLWSLVDGVLSKSSDFGVTQAQVLDARPASNGSNYYYSSYQLQRSDDQHLLVVRSSQGYVNGNWVYDNRYWRSQDGGATWDTPSMQGLPVDATNYSFNFQFAGPGVLLGSSNGVLYRSGDGGGSWTVATLPQGNTYFYSATFFALTDQLLTAFMNGVSWVSRDGGQTWTTMAQPATQDGYFNYSNPTSVQWMPAQGAMQLFLGDGSIHRSTDNGQTWTRLLASSNVPYANQLGSFWALDAKHALGVNTSGQLMETTDGGRSWAVKQSGLYSGWASRIAFTSPKIGWLYVGDGRLYRTTDGGATWLTGLNSNFYVASFQFTDADNGFAVNGSSLSQSKDGGLSWTDVSTTLPSGTYRVAFQNATHGIAFGSNGISETSDGGLTWTPRYTGSTTSINAASYVDAKTVWALGSTGDVLLSTDGGTNWQRVTVPVTGFTPSGVSFLDAKRGWIVGSGGTVLATVDGGKTWQKQASGTSRVLWKVQFVDSKTGWILGENGTLMVSGTGGN